MKRFMLVVLAVFVAVAIGCNTTEDANEKIEQCLVDEHGDEAESLLDEWEITCDDKEEACKDCVDCVMDEECGAILDGACDELCE